MENNTTITAGKNGTVAITHAAASSGFSIVVLVGILIAIVVPALIIILLLKRKKTQKKNAIAIKIFIPTSTELKLEHLSGFETVEMTQRMLDFTIGNLPRRIKMPPPSSFVYNTLFLVQISDVEFRPLILQSEKTTNYEVKSALKKLSEREPDTLSEDGKNVLKEGAYKAVEITDKERDALLNYLEIDRLVPIIDPAFAISYAQNVERIITATATEEKDFWSKLSKFMPAILIIITAVAAILILYGMSQFSASTFSKIAQQLGQGLTVSCSSAPPVTTTVPPSVPI